METQVRDYGNRPCYGELASILLVGLFHVVVELVFFGAAATAFNIAVSIAFLAYVIWRFVRTPGVLQIWGFGRTI